MVPFSGWHMPVQYAGITAEHQAVRTRAGLFDVSHMGELLLTGEGAAAFVNRLGTNHLSRIEPGRGMYTCCCNEAGGILDDLIVYKRSDTDVLVVCNAGNRDKISRYFAERAAGECGFSDASDEIALLALQGPRALEVLVAAGSSIVDPAASLASFRFREGSVAGLRTPIARTGYTRQDGGALLFARR